jgi:lipoate-protein ligase A
MAIDEVLLAAAVGLGGVLLRFYGWSETAATFGYGQRFREVALWTPLRPLIRRPTGGGLVEHARDWTYSLVVPPSDPWYDLPAAQSYRRLHEWLAGALARLGVRATLAAEPSTPAPGQCFAGPERLDLVCGETKLAGAAQRRTRGGLLIQGSVQPAPTGVAAGSWQEACRREAADRFGVAWADWEPDAELRARAEALRLAKYEQAAHNLRR